MSGDGAQTGKDERAVCFVVMGFGEKVAYDKDHKPRTLDLDATFEAIIKPAVEDAGLRCIRADMMLNSGMIDTRMFEMLLRADLVVADISTGNVNAVYELGVRHALRPHSTIVMQENKAAFHFDLSHISTFTYTHLGSDIGAREAAKKKAELQKLVETIMATPTRDSPVYEFLQGLSQPAMSGEDYENMVTVIEEQGDDLQQLIEQGKAAKRAAKKPEDFVEAVNAFEKALALMTRVKSEDESAVGLSERDFVVQQLALVTYKSKQPSEKEALLEGLEVIGQLEPAQSHDTETLGIAGAMHKRIWQTERDRAHLDKAIEYYGRGFNVKQDYYNGENYALCLMMRAEQHADEDEAAYDRMTARKVRKQIVDLLELEFSSDAIEERGDRVWMHATMANSLFALSRDDEAQQHEDKFRELAGDTQWMLDAYEGGKQEMLRQRDG
jgi:hypothetical protein